MNKDEFAKLVEGLFYQSETSAPLIYFELYNRRSQQWPPATACQFLRMIGADAAILVRELAITKFFVDLKLGNEGREDQVDILQKAMAEGLQHVRGFLIGDIRINIYLLGRNVNGKVCGLRTLSVVT